MVSTLHELIVIRPKSKGRRKPTHLLLIMTATMFIAMLSFTRDASAHHLCRQDNGGAHGQILTTWEDFQSLPLNAPTGMQLPVVESFP